MPRDARTRRGRKEKALRESRQLVTNTPEYPDIQGNVITKDDFVKLISNNTLLETIPTDVLMKHLEKKIDDELVKNFINEVQRHLITYPNTVLGNILRPWLPRSLMDIQELAKREPVVQLALIVLRSELFRRGIQIRKRWWGKCNNPKCELEYEEKPPDLGAISERQFSREGIPCEECNKGRIWPPDKKQRDELKEFIRCVNLNKESLKSVAEQCEDDLNKFDNMYMGFLKDYRYKGKKLVSTLREIVRLDPTVMLISADERGVIGKKAVTCLFHRNFIIERGDGEDNNFYMVANDLASKEQNNQTSGFTSINGKKIINEIRCPICGDDRLYPVWYIATKDGSLATLEQAFIENEVRHKNRYNPSPYYGYSPILVAWQYATSLIDMTKYIYDYFRNQQIPRGMLAIPGTPESVKAAKAQTINELKKNKHSTPWFNIPINADGKAMAMPQFIAFTNTLDELQYTAVRDEFRLRITAQYGVSPFFQNDTTQSGGLNSEDLQLTLTNQRIEVNQGTWNTVEDQFGVLEDVTRMIGITDWELYLPPPMEADQVAPLKRKQEKIAIAEAMQRLGYDNELPAEGLTDETDFYYTKRTFDPNQGAYGGNNNLFSQPNMGTTGPDNNSNGNIDPNALDENGKLKEDLTHNHPHPHHPGSTTIHSHEHTHRKGSNPDTHAHKHDENDPEQSIDQGQSSEQDDSSSDSNIDNNEPKTPRGETDYQNKKTRNIQRNILNSTLLKINPVDKLADELFSKITLYYKQLILIGFANKFANRDPTTIHEIEIIDALVELFKTAEKEIQNFGMNFANAAFNLGILMVQLSDESVSIEDRMPHVTITGLLDIGQAENDTYALRAYDQANSYREAFASFNMDVSNQFRELVRNSLTTDKKTIDQLVEAMQDIVTTEAYKLHRIARTEVTRFSNEGRILQYKKIEQDYETEFKYIWFVNHDDRLSKICMTIEQRVPVNGVSLEELYKILVEAQHEFMGPTWQASWLVHPHCRSRPLRKI